MPWPSEKLVDRYMNGRCHELARALHRLKGWPILVTDTEDHAVVELTRWAVLDIKGPRTKADALEDSFSGSCWKLATARATLSWHEGMDVKHDPTHAMRTARRLLKYWGLDVR